MTAVDEAPAGGRAARFFARALVRGRYLVIAGWVAAALTALLALPGLGGGGGSASLKGLVPSDTPAVSAELRSVELFGFPLLGRTVVVQRDPDGLSPYAQARTAVAAAAVTRERYDGLSAIRGALPLTNSLGVLPGSRERDTTALTYLLFDPDRTLGAQTRSAQRYTERFFSGRDAVIGVSGSVPARAAQGDLIRDALPRVELFTLLAIMLIVGIALRSIVAPLIALLCAGLSYLLTLRLSGALAELLGVSTPSELEPVVVALLLGVVTDYVVFYLAAMRREMRRGASPREAAELATVRFGPIVVVAGLAVAAGTGALLFAQSLFFRALGPALVFTVVVGLVVAATVVPALMAVLGKWCFWPLVPRPVETTGGAGHDGTERPAGEPEEAGRPAAFLDRVVAAVTASRARSAQVVVASVAVLVIAAIPITSLGLGVSFVGSLPADNGVRVAASAARAGVAPGALSPTTVLLEGVDLQNRGDDLERLGRLLEAQPGVAGVLGPGDVGQRIEREVLVRPDGTAARYLLVLDDPALGAAAIGTVDALQDDLGMLLSTSGLDDVDASLAGDSATAAYIVDQTSADLVRIAVAALLANLLMLIAFLRAVVAAVYLLLGSVLSLTAALGLTSLVFDGLDPGAGLTFYVPFAVAVLLLAFGSDYNIFAVGSIWDEARNRRLGEAIRRAMPATIAAIFVAGVTLAASFGLLGVVPLVPFRQLAFAMAVGIMLDVVVVRSLLLPALLTLVGPISAWPSRRLRRDDAPTAPAAGASPGSPAAGTTAAR